MALLGCLHPGAKRSWQSGRTAPGDGWWRWVFWSLFPLLQKYIYIHMHVPTTDRVTRSVLIHTQTHTDCVPCGINKTFGVIDGIASKPQLKNKQRNHKNTSRNVFKWKWKCWNVRRVTKTNANSNWKETETYNKIKWKWK